MAASFETDVEVQDGKQEQSKECLRRHFIEETERERNHFVADVVLQLVNGGDGIFHLVRQVAVEVREERRHVYHDYWIT